MGTFKIIKWSLNKKVGINDVGLYKPNQHDKISGSNTNELLQNKCALHTSKQSFAEHPGNINKLPTVAMSKNIDWELELTSNTDQMLAHKSIGHININRLPHGTVTIFH